jgi:hypothetical protein
MLPKVISRQGILGAVREVGDRGGTVVMDVEVAGCDTGTAGVTLATIGSDLLVDMGVMVSEVLVVGDECAGVR